MLKFSYPTEAEVPAALKPYFKKQEDGTFQIEIEGAVPVAKLAEFRENNRTLKAENDKFKADFEGVDPAEFKKLKSRAELVEDGKLVGADKIEEKIAARVAAMKAENDKSVAELTKARDAAEAQVANFMIDGELRRAGTELGVLDTAFDDVILRGKTTFRMVDGKPTAFGADGKEIYSPSKGEALSVREYVEGLAKTAPHLFKASSGSGSEGSKNPGTGSDNPWKEGQINLTKQMEITRANPSLAAKLKAEAGKK